MRAVAHEVVVGDDFRPDETPLDITVDGAGRFAGRLPAADGPRPHFVAAGRQEADEAELLERRLGDDLRSRTGQAQGHGVFRLLLDRKLGNLERVWEGESKQSSSPRGYLEAGCLGVLPSSSVLSTSSCGVRVRNW